MPGPIPQGVRTAWNAANQPLVQVPQPFAIGPDEQMALAAEAQRNPGGWAAMRLAGLLGRQVGNLGADTLSSMTSPVGLASMALSGGASAAGRAGMLGISRGARLGEAALNAPAVAQGTQQAVTARSPGEALGGLATAALGASGARGAGRHGFPVPKVANAYLKEAGIKLPPSRPVSQIDRRIATKVADAYDAMRHAPDDPKVARAYAALAKETGDQFEFVVKRAGVKVEKWKGKGEPYKNSQAMADDLKKNNHLYYLPTTTEFGKGAAKEGADNPLLKKGRYGLPVNDEFRAIHDYFGHAKEGYGFGPVGEENAARAHSAMFTPEARKAMLSETRGQNSWVNYGPQMRRPDGSIPRLGDPDYVPLPEREFAPQKTGLLPDVMTVPEPSLASMSTAPIDYSGGNRYWAPVEPTPPGPYRVGPPHLTRPRPAQLAPNVPRTMDEIFALYGNVPQGWPQR
jgi:hypothetical protein